MKVLIVKTSSLGDVIHTLPALTDAGKHLPDLRFDWAVEEAFAEVPSWHPLVERVIPLALRRWRKKPLATLRNGQWQVFKKQLQQEKYDLVIDAQGLMKSAFVTFFTRGVRCGLNFKAAWEPLASLVYQRRFYVNPDQHAVTRMRQLFAAVLGYSLDADSVADYGLDATRLNLASIAAEKANNYLVFLHGTTWDTKHWPESYWQELARLVDAAGISIKIPWGNAAEQQRAQRIADNLLHAEVLPKLNLQGIAKVLAGAKANVAVDTGLGHLAAALNVPTLSLYGPTNAILTGTQGANQYHFSAKFACAPCLQSTCRYQGPRKVEPACFGNITPQQVWQRLQKLLADIPSSFKEES